MIVYKCINRKCNYLEHYEDSSASKSTSCPECGSKLGTGIRHKGDYMTKRDHEFICDDCEVETVYQLNAIDRYPMNCEKCGGNLQKKVGLPSLSINFRRNDPTSPDYWKKGKSNNQIADTILGESDPY